MTTHFLFVYGTLRQSGSNSLLKMFPNSRFVGNAAVCGRLYDLGDYPAILLDSSAAPVAGEVYEIDNDTLTALDEFEASAGYGRKRIEILVHGERTPCLLYDPEPEMCEGKELIGSGDWIKYSGSDLIRNSE